MPFTWQGVDQGPWFMPGKRLYEWLAIRSAGGGHYSFPPYEAIGAWWAAMSQSHNVWAKQMQSQHCHSPAACCTQWARLAAGSIAQPCLWLPWKPIPVHRPEIDIGAQNIGRSAKQGSCSLAGIAEEGHNRITTSGSSGWLSWKHAMLHRPSSSPWRNLPLGGGGRQWH